MNDWRILSMRQPWLWAVRCAKKRVENRRLKWAFTGPILLHEAVGLERREYAEACLWMENAGVAKRVGVFGIGDVPIIPTFDALSHSGAIVARTSIDGRIDPDGFHIGSRHTVDERWHMKNEGQYGYVLGDVVDTSVVPVRGMLGLIKASPEILEKLGLSS